ncbi:diacylglycerol/polyprenol kinase family protein [Microscilla marina]|uniref:Phosphatidate cytidylyltransferase n=1 Tax=Microscilla marina ATCC 23134 TaxID=313606 RepID=A1ZKN4_MICM2|nr:hypothetical protein [Microscilla marina]EAY29260.1 phosphatidate cytidylyltransferase [Microscilla marina ATCC 23134]
MNTIYLAIAYLVLFASAEFFYHRLKTRAEITRKYVHIVTGLLTMLFPPLIQNHWLVLLLCSSFLIILLASLYFKLLPSINAVERTTRGSILYPVIVYCCYLMYLSQDQFIFYYIPILILTLCDPMAALVGKHFPRGKYITFGHCKTLSGSAGFFAAAVITSLCLVVGLEQMTLTKTLIITVSVAMVTTIAEALSHKGYDNLTIPFSALAMLMLINHYL